MATRRSASSTSSTRRPRRARRWSAAPRRRWAAVLRGARRGRGAGADLAVQAEPSADRERQRRRLDHGHRAPSRRAPDATSSPIRPPPTTSAARRPPAPRAAARVRRASAAPARSRSPRAPAAVPARAGRDQEVVVAEALAAGELDHPRARTSAAPRARRAQRDVLLRVPVSGRSQGGRAGEALLRERRAVVGPLRADDGDGAVVAQGRRVSQQRCAASPPPTISSP